MVRSSQLHGGTAQKMKFSISDFFSKLDQIPMKPRILSHLLKKSVLENFIFCAVRTKIVPASSWLQFGKISISFL